MSSVGDRLTRLVLALVPVVIIAVGCGGASLLPRALVAHAITALTAWLTLSVLVGIVVGHCALGEADYP
jgi:hypothetical protein